MKPAAKKNRPVNSLLLYSVVFICSIFLQLQAKSNSIIIDSSVNVIDGLNPLFNIQAGDTVFLRSGSRNKLLIRNFKGSPGKPILFINKNGVVSISTNDYYGISIIHCSYIRLSGQGSAANLYGIQIKKVAAGCGIGIGASSSDFEIDHIAIENCFTEGIFAKTDPDCSSLVTRDNFTQFNTSIHHNYIADIGNEGMYIGSSYYLGMKLNCNGKDTVVMPPVLDGVTIYNNIIKNTGWDGLQISSAPLHCQIFNNSIENDGQAEVPNQMSGILMGGGSSCDCNNNFISNGKGDGIENHGLGGNRIFNNIIVNAGRTYLPHDASQMKHGIFVSDVSAVKDSSVSILFNNIITPKSDGIRFQNIKSKHNLIASNLIIDPGNYALYESGNTSFTGKDAYVMIPNKAADVQLKNNFFSRNFFAAGISSADYTIQAGSPLINTGYAANHIISSDFRTHRRPAGGLYDIGAMEYDAGIDTLLHTFSQKPQLYPNPANGRLIIKYLSLTVKKMEVNIFASNGNRLMQQSSVTALPGVQQLPIEVRHLPCGIYFYTIRNGYEIFSGTFIKL
jgi:Right handed beta helix region/Secretion system C-terminal sorting domain